MSTPYETPREPRADQPSGWHPVNVGHLVVGVAFVGLFVVWVLVEQDAVDLIETGWVMALPWLAAGAIGLMATVFRHHAGPRGRMHGWVGHSGRMHGWMGHKDSRDSRD